MRAIAEVEIQRTPEEVFSFLATHANHTRFVDGNILCQQVTPGEMGVGTQLKNVARMMGKEMVEHFTVTEFDPPRVLGKATQQGAQWDTTDRFELRPSALGTHVRFEVTGNARSLGQRIILVLLGQLMKRVLLPKTLGKLKAVLEQAPGGAT